MGQDQIRVLRELAASSRGQERLDVLFRIATGLDQIAMAARSDASAAATATRAYADLVSAPGFASFRRADEALAMYAGHLASHGDPAGARGLYSQLLAHYPRSAYVPDAYLALGEHYFAENQMQEAEEAFVEVLKYPASRGFDHATYKLAWVHYNTQRYQTALNLFAALARGSKHPVIRQAALRDTVRVYAEVGAPDAAHGFFQTLDRTQAGSLVHSLSELYLDTGKYDQAMTVLRQLEALDPDPDRLCGKRLLQLRARVGAGRRAEISEAAGRLVAVVFERDQQCLDESEALLGNLAFELHVRAARTHDRELMKLALELWQHLVIVFTDPPRDAVASRGRAMAAWASAVSAEDWAGAAEAMHWPDAGPDLNLAELDAWDNCVRMLQGTPPDPTLTRRIRHGLAQVAGARARALLGQLDLRVSGPRPARR
jgi:tetratricopeptide (TPR) repeat protein